MDSHWMKVRGWGTARRRKREEDVLNYFKKNLVTWAALPHRLCEYYSITVHCFCYAEFHTSGYDCFFRPNKKKELPIHYGIKCFHSIQVRVAVVTSNCKNSAHQRCDANSPPWGCKLCDILPFVTTWVKALHGTQRRVVIEATCKESPYTEMWPLPMVVIAQMCIAGLFLACSGLEPQSMFLTKSQSRMKIKQQLSPLSTSSCSTFKKSHCWKPKEETNPWIRLTSVMRSHWCGPVQLLISWLPLLCSSVPSLCFLLLHKSTSYRTALSNAVPLAYLPTTYRQPWSSLTPLPALRWPISFTSIHLSKWGSYFSTLERDAMPSLPPTA